MFKIQRGSNTAGILAINLDVEVGLVGDLTQCFTSGIIDFGTFLLLQRLNFLNYCSNLYEFRKT